MWKLLRTLVSGFLLLRDIFGYLLPGALFLGLAGAYGWLLSPENSKQLLYQYLDVAPSSFFVTLLLLLSYLLGQVLVAIGFAIVIAVDRLMCSEEGAAPSLQEELYYAYLYPALFTEASRRSTINILRIGIAVSLTCGSFFFWSYSRSAFWTVLLIGLFMLNNGRTGMAHVVDIKAGTIEAAKRAAQNSVPAFDWGDGVQDCSEETAKTPAPGAKPRASAQKAGKG